MNGPIPFSDQQIKEMCRCYREGASLSALAEHFGISITAVKARLLANHVKMRPKGAQPGKHRSVQNEQ